MELLPGTPPELVKLCEEKLDEKKFMIVNCSIKDCLKIRGDSNAFLEVKAEMQKIIYEYCRWRCIIEVRL